jgi:hypothetical protein
MDSDCGSSPFRARAIPAISGVFVVKNSYT